MTLGFEQDSASIHFYSIEDKVGVGDKVISSAKRAIAMVWNLHCSFEPTHFKLGFYRTAYDEDTGENIDCAETYDPDNDWMRLIVGTDSYQSFLRLGYSEEMVTTILAAHCAMHRVQRYRDGRIRGSRSYKNYDEYIHSKSEDEAWRESLEVFTALFPGYDGYKIAFPERDKLYTIPRFGKYSK